MYVNSKDNYLKFFSETPEDLLFIKRKNLYFSPNISMLDVFLTLRRKAENVACGEISISVCDIQRVMYSIWIPA